MDAATFKHIKYVLGENPVTLFAFVLFTVFVLFALAGPWIAPYDPLMTDTASALKPRSKKLIKLEGAILNLKSYPFMS